MNARWLAYATGAGIFLLDRLTKWLIETRLSVWDTLVVIPGFFNIIHTRNTGAAFSLFSGASPAWRGALLVGISLVALALVASLLWRGPCARQDRWMRLGLSLILGGALGNIYDRLAYGAVTDFLEFYIGPWRWPAFNLADSAITAGVALVLLDMWRVRRAPRGT